jgi:hypothetical protein
MGDRTAKVFGKESPRSVAKKMGSSWNKLFILIS